MRKVYIRAAVGLTVEALEFLPDEPGLRWEKALGMVEHHMGPDFAELLRDLRGEIIELERIDSWGKGVKAGEDMIKGRVKRLIEQTAREEKKK